MNYDYDKNQKRKKFNKYFGMCWYCGTMLDVMNFETDYIFPKSKGGGNTIDNLAGTCSDCNRQKGSLLLEEFRDKIKNLAGEKTHKDSEFRLGVKFQAVKIKVIEPVFFFEKINRLKELYLSCYCDGEKVYLDFESILRAF